MSGAFFNAPTQAGNLDLAMTSNNGITTTTGDLSLTANDNGAISIGNTSTGQVQLTVNNSGVIIQDNLQVLGDQNTFNADDITTSTLRMNNETLGDSDNVSVSKSVSLINRTGSGDNTVTIPVKSYLHNELSQDGLIKNIFYDESSVATSDQAGTSTTVDFTWPKYYPVGPVTHKVVATTTAAFANRDALNGLSVGTADTDASTVTVGTVTVNYHTHSGSTWLNEITESTNPGDWTVTTSTSATGTFAANDTVAWTKDLFVKIVYVGQSGATNTLIFENSAPNPSQNATAFQTALTAASAGDIIELADGVYNTLTVNKSVKIVSAPGTKALLQGGMKISSPSALPIDGLELVNLKMQGNCGLNSATVSQSASTGFVKNVNIVGCEFDGKEVADSKFWYGKFNVGYWKFNSCVVTGYKSWYLMDNTGSSTFTPIPFAGCTEYLSDVQIVNCHFYNNCGTATIRGGGGSTDGNGGQDPTVMVKPIDTTLVQNTTFDLTGVTMVGWGAIEVNKVKNLTLTNNIFKGKGNNPRTTKKLSWGFYVQCWGVPGESEGSWALNVTKNSFEGVSTSSDDNGGIIIANGTGSSEKGWGGSFIPLPNPNANISENNFVDMDHGISALQWYKDNGSGGYASITWAGSDQSTPGEILMQPGKINCHDNHWGSGCQPSQLGTVGWGEFEYGSGDYQHLYSANSEGASVTPNVVTTDLVPSAPTVAANSGQNVVVTSEGNYYPVYLNEPVVQETVEFRVRVFDRQGHAGKAYFVYNTNCNQWEESPVLRMKPSNLYLFKFDLASDLSSYPLALSSTSDGTHNSGTSYEQATISPGTVDGQFITVYAHVHDDNSTNLHYFCTGTSGMGNEVATQRTARTDSGNNVIDVAWDTDAATSATAVETAITGAPEGSIIRLEGGSAKPWGAINITKSCKLVSKTNETAHLTGGIVLTPPDDTVIDGVELWNLSVKGGAANTNESPGGTTCLWVDLNGTAQGAVNNLKIMNCEFDGEGTSGAKHFANFTYVTGELTIDNCNIHDFGQHYYLCGMSQGWLPKASIVNNAEGYLSDVVFTNNHIHNCVGTPAFRGGAGTNDNGTDPDTCFVETPINTATVTGNKFDYTSTASGEGIKGWNCIEVNKCVSLVINDNHFINHRRGDTGAGYNQDFAHGFAVQAFAYDNWGLEVCNNHFQNDAGMTDKTGGVYVHLAAWTQSDNGLGGASVKMAAPATMISGNSFNGTENAIYFGQGFQEFIDNDFSDVVRTDVGQTPPQVYAPNNWFGAGGASKRQRLVGSTSNHDDYDTSNGGYSTASFGNWTDFVGLSVVEHFVDTDAKAKQTVGTITLLDANNKTMRFNVLSTTATNSLKGQSVTTGLSGLAVTYATTQALLETDSVAVEVAKSNTLSSDVYIRLSDGTDTVEFINVGVQNGTVTPNVNMNVYEEDALTTVGLNATPLDTHEKEKLLVVGGGLASALKFNSTGQSANILYLGGKWRVVQAGAAVVM